MEKNSPKNGVFEVRSKTSDRLTVKEAKILFKELELADCPYKTLDIRPVMSAEISILLYKALSKNKSITAINGEHMFAHESAYLKALKKNPDLPLKSLVLSFPGPPKKFSSYFQQNRQLTNLSLTFNGHGTRTDLDETIEAIATHNTTLEHIDIHFDDSIIIGPSSIEQLLRQNQGLRSVSIDICGFTCHHRMIVKKFSNIGIILAKLPLLTSLKFLVGQFDSVEVEAFLESLKESKTIREMLLNQYWIGVGSLPLLADILAIRTLEVLRLKNYTEMYLYKYSVNENHLIDVSPLFACTSQLREIECNFIPYMKEKLFAALEANNTLRRIYIQPQESPRVLMRLYEELEDKLQIDICLGSTQNLPYELLLEHHHRSTKRRELLSIKLNLTVISAARDRGLFSILPQELLEVIWYKLLRTIVSDISGFNSASIIFDRLGAPYRK